jgi:peroxiredoxin
MLIPFETLWNSARKGTLSPGETAPEFQLTTTDHKVSVNLSQLRGKPVVLVFGSYT